MQMEAVFQRGKLIVFIFKGKPNNCLWKLQSYLTSLNYSYWGGWGGWGGTSVIEKNERKKLLVTTSRI